MVYLSIILGVTHPSNIIIVNLVCFTLMGKAKLIEEKHVDTKSVLLTATFWSSSIMFLNLSMAYNSLGFYQACKLMTTPTLMIIQYRFFGKEVSKSIVFSIFPVIAGVGMITVGDIEVNAKVGHFCQLTPIHLFHPRFPSLPKKIQGTVLAVSALFTTAGGQVISSYN